MKRSYDGVATTAKRSRPNFKTQKRTQTQRVLSLIHSQAEKKEIWASAVTTGIATSGSVVNLTVCGQGDSAFLRTGNKIMMYDFVIDFTIVAGLVAGSASNLNNVDAGCVWLVLDTHPDGNTTAFSTVFDMNNSNSAGGATFKNEENNGNGNRFIVLREWPWAVGKGGDGCKHFREYVNLRKELSLRHQQCHYTSSLSDEPTSNGLLLCYANTISTAASVLTYNERFRFTDL